MRIMGIDPSFRNFGYAMSAYVDGSLHMEKIALVETAKGKNLKQVRKSSDDFRRAREQADGLLEMFRYDPHIVMVEVPHGSQSASGALSKGVCLGVLASINVPVVQLTEQEVKKGSIGKKNASKAEMIEWATALYPELEWPTYGGKFQLKCEHMADAIATIHAGILTDEFQMASAFLRTQVTKIPASYSH